jgi:hypothetical protein
VAVDDGRNGMGGEEGGQSVLRGVAAVDKWI